MVQDILVGLAVSFGYILGPLLGSWTTDEAIKLKELDFITYLRASKFMLPVLFASIMWVYWLLDIKELGAIGVFALILAQTSLTAKRKLDKNTLRQGAVFLVVFSFLILIK